MEVKTETVDSYLNQLSEERKALIQKLRICIKENLPEGFEETISYGMIGYVVPLSVYKDGYHCKKNEPLPFISLASQKNFIALYHMGIYANPALLGWFTINYPKHSKTKLDMGKSCMRFKKPEDIPYALIAELVAKITVQEWIATYETAFKPKN
ncbi:DUF1801 domain-containing protein [Pedobacter alpinus]|uniref:DUF1801 domain-containing protein n=1 Tax=Pedobacter alpinus TaxID=1590643 RepID=A0ABW5TMB8_9SPHI